MIAALAVLALGQISGDPLLAFLDNRIPVAKSVKALRASLSQWYDVADYAFDDYVFRPDGVRGWVFPLVPGSEMDGGTVALARPVGKMYRLESLMQLDSIPQPLGWEGVEGYFVAVHLSPGVALLLTLA